MQPLIPMLLTADELGVITHALDKLPSADKEKLGKQIYSIQEKMITAAKALAVVVNEKKPNEPV